MLRMPLTALVLLLLLASCRRPWTDRDKQQFLGGCLHGTVKLMGEKKSKAYCSCMLQTVLKRYPNAADARYMRQDTAMARLSQECLKQP